MRKLQPFLLGSAVWLLATGVFAAQNGATASVGAGGGIPAGATVVELASSADACPFGALGRGVYGPETGLPLEGTTEVAPGPRHLPSPPSSLVLGLSALAGLGVVQAGRTIRKVQLAAVPDWYHEHARPIGHSTPFELERVFLPACILEPLVDLTAAVLHTLTAGRDLGPPARLIPLAAAPRAPPLPARS